MSFNQRGMLYKTNGKKNSYKWMRKKLLMRFDMDYLRYEMMIMFCSKVLLSSSGWELWD